MSDAMSALRILVVDDQSAMRRIITDLLHKVGISNVQDAPDGKEALEILRKPNAKMPDVIISDLYMDKMDGLEFCQQLRMDPMLKEKHLPVLILTGEHDEFVLDVAAQVGSVKVLTKPISGPDLAAEIAQVVGYQEVS